MLDTYKTVHIMHIFADPTRRKALMHGRHFGRTCRETGCIGCLVHTGVQHCVDDDYLPACCGMPATLGTHSMTAAVTGRQQCSGL